MDRLRNPSLWIVFLIAALTASANFADVPLRAQRWCMNIAALLGIFGGVFFPAVFGRAPAPLAATTADLARARTLEAPAPLIHEEDARRVLDGDGK